LKSASRIKLLLCVTFLASFAAVALGVAAPPGRAGQSKTYYFVGGHTFGIGEQQVYIIERHVQLNVRYRDASGALTTRRFRQNAKSSVAWTIEGIASTGGPILGVATTGPRSPGSATPAPPADYAAGPAAYAAQPSPTSAPPSPVLDSQGAASGSVTMADLGPASVILSSLVRELPDVGKPWKSSGDVRLPYGTLTLRLNNVVEAATGDQDESVMRISSDGTADYRGKFSVAGFGSANLLGGGGTSGATFVESKNRLLLGMTLATTSRGNASAKDRRGNYDLSVKIAIKLVRYVPGIPQYVGSPGFVPASGYLGGTSAPDTQIYSTAVPDKVTVPAPTDTGFVAPPMQPVTPYPSALPEMSLPPIPIPIGSGQPVASPPPPPTPTPQPTHY
jgi:hypothetical protein